MRSGSGQIWLPALPKVCNFASQQAAAAAAQQASSRSRGSSRRARARSRRWNSSSTSRGSGKVHHGPACSCHEHICCVCLHGLACTARTAALVCYAGVHARAAAQVLHQLDSLQQPLADLSSGSLEGDWEGALELVGRVADALRMVRSSQGAGAQPAAAATAVPRGQP